MLLTQDGAYYCIGVWEKTFGVKFFLYICNFNGKIKRE